MNKQMTAYEWFLKAQYAYQEHHQACPWCDGAYRVRVSRQGGKQIYCCQRCDFQASFDVHSNRYQIVPGEEQSVAAETMFEMPATSL